MSKDEAEKTFWTTVVSAVLFVVFGTYLLFKPDLAITIISRFLTLITTAIGIFGLYKYITRKNKEKKIDINIIYSIVSFIIAIIVYINPLAISGLIPIVLGTYMLINTILKISYLKQLNKNKNKDFGTCILIFIIMLILGIIMIFNPLKTVLNINQTMGIIIVFYSVLDLILCYLFKNNIL